MTAVMPAASTAAPDRLRVMPHRIEPDQSAAPRVTMEMASNAVGPLRATDAPHVRAIRIAFGALSATAA